MSHTSRFIASFVLLLSSLSVAPVLAAPSQDPPAGYCALWQVPPSSVVPGESFEAKLFLQNTGKATWSKSTYFVASVDPAFNTRWGVSKMGFSKAVRQDNTAILTVQATAPMEAGDYDFNWQLGHDQNTFFGTPCQYRIHVGF